MERWGFTFPLDGLALPAHRELLPQIESWGYTDLWTAEADGTDAFTPAAVAAAYSSKLRIGTAIANVFTRGPALLAMTASAMAEAAPGRFCLGIGASSPAIVEGWNGVELRRPLERVRETLRFVRAAMAGEKAASAALGVRGFRLGRRLAETPPIFVGALREKMLALAGSEAEGAIINWLSPDDVPKTVVVARDAAKAAGRDPDALDIVCRIFVMPPAPDDVVRFIGRRAIAGYFTTPVYSAFHQWLGRGEALRPMQEAWQAGDRQTATELVPDRVIEEIFVMGSRQERLDRIEAYCRNGVTTPVFMFLPAAFEPKDQADRSVAMLKELARV
jgi:probable F420-dependent oxidoreductase